MARISAPFMTCSRTIDELRRGDHGLGGVDSYLSHKMMVARLTIPR